MTLYEFKLLCPDEQAAITWKDGAFIAVGDRGHIKVLLYQIYSFYVEVYYNCEWGKIEEFNSFDATDQLEPYLAAVDLSDLVPVIPPRDPQPAPPSRFRTQVWKTLCKLFPLAVAVHSFFLF
jgi:hypothetical protein